MTIGPQPGPQTTFLSSPADIAIYGGAAGGGKTFALLLDPLRAVAKQGFACVFFRRESVQITASGGVWDKAQDLYGQAGASFRQAPQLEARWPTGSVIQFRHLQHDSDRLSWQGAELACILFDELTHFSEAQFWYLVSRNRSTCGVRPWIRASCNPEPGWVADLLAWWIGDDGYAIPERSGVLRWFLRRDDELRWFDSEEEALEHCDEGERPRSLTFVSASLDDNPALTEADPGYRAALLSLPTVERERLLAGNWQVATGAELYRYARWMHLHPRKLPGGLRWVRYWDLAATEPSPSNPDPDYTASALIARHRDRDGNEWLYVRDGQWCRRSPSGVEDLVREVGERDGRSVPVWVEEEPGASGKLLVRHFGRSVLPRHAVKGDRPSGEKVSRQRPVVAAAENARLVFVDEESHADWIVQAKRWASTYPEGKRDFWDAVAGGFKVAPVTRDVDATRQRRHSATRQTPGAVAPPRRM